MVVAISSRALFDLEESHHLFETEGVDAYARYQVAHEDEVLGPGVAFPLAEKLLALNRGPGSRKLVDIILLSPNSADTGLRVFNSLRHYGLDISLAVFSGGKETAPYIGPFRADLFLSADAQAVRQTLQSGHAAATIIPRQAGKSRFPELRIAFDGDAVIFSDEAERVFREQGLSAFAERETEQAREPLPGGPFRNFLATLHKVQTEFPKESVPIRTALVTARAAPAHERVIRTLRAWNIRIDEMFFLGGRDKSPFLEAFGADIFFDDQTANCERAAPRVATGHVPGRPEDHAASAGTPPQGSTGQSG
jgi:5'-nucleotidase